MERILSGVYPMAFRKYGLKPLTVLDTALNFEWDSKKGIVRGRDAALVLDLVAYAMKQGMLTGYPYPTQWKVTSPLRSERDMAVVLGQHWQLRDDLLAAYPRLGGLALPETGLLDAARTGGNPRD